VNSPPLVAACELASRVAKSNRENTPGVSPGYFIIYDHCLVNTSEASMPPRHILLLAASKNKCSFFLQLSEGFFMTLVTGYVDFPYVSL
jgi:hypothetical protein